MSPFADRRLTRLCGWISLGIIALTAIAYWQTADHDFVRIDDQKYVTENDFVRNGLSFRGFVYAWTEQHGANWHPLTTLSHQLDCTLFGLDAGKHHLVNIVLHAVNSVLLFIVLTSMTGSKRLPVPATSTKPEQPRTSKKPRGDRRKSEPNDDQDQPTIDFAAVWKSAFVGALFAVHPLHVESVAWVSERKDVLSTLFWLLAMAAYVAYVRRPDWRRYLLVTAALALGLLAKPMVVTLPAALLLLDYWPLSRWIGAAETEDEAKGEKPRAKRRRGERKLSLRQLVQEKFPWFGLVVVSCIMTVQFQQLGGAVHSAENTPIPLRIENAIVSYVVYLWKTIWPVNLVFFYPHPKHYGGLPWYSVAGSLLVLVAITSGVLYAGRRYRYLLTGWLWYLGTLVPVIGIVQVGDQAMADRYMYVPSIGLFVLLIWGAADLSAKWFRTSRAWMPASAVVLFALTALCWRQVATWRNTGTLADHALSVSENNYYAWYLHGVAAMQTGNVDEAMSAFNRSLKELPIYANARFDLGKLLLDANRFDEAEKHFRRLEKTRPDLADRGLRVLTNRRALSWYERAAVSLGQGNQREAAAQLRRAIELQPDYPSALNDLAWILATSSDAQLRNGQEALRLAKRATKLYPNSLMLDTLAAAYAEVGNFDEAVRVAEQAMAQARQDPQQMMPPGIEQRLRGYQQRKPYRDA